MAGVWDYRQLRHGEYEVRRDGKPHVLVALDSRVQRHSLTMAKIVEAIAAAQDEPLADSA